MEQNFSENITDNKKIRKKNQRSSVYLITINTNKSLKSRNDHVIKNIDNIRARFKTFLLEFFTEQNIKKLCVDMGRVGTRKEDYIFPCPSEKIKKIEYRISLEANLQNTGNIHSHIMIKIIHSTRIQINIAVVKNVAYKYFSEILNGDKPYINIQARADSAFLAENYVEALPNEEIIKEAN